MSRNNINRPASKATALLSLAGVLIVVIVALIFALGPNKTTEANTVNVNDYLIYDISGYNNYGSVEIKIDYEKIVDKFQVTDAEKQETLNSVAKFPLFDISYSSSNTLKNDDTVSFKLSENKPQIVVFEEIVGCKIKFEENGTWVVNGFEDVVDFDPFENIVIDASETVNGEGTFSAFIEYRNGDKFIKWTVEHDGANGVLKNGDIVNLKIKEEIDADLIARELGIRLTRTTCDNYEITELLTSAVDESIFDAISEMDQRTLDGIIDAWVISSLNDDNPADTNRKYEHFGYIYMTNNEPIEDGSKVDGKLLSIYKITDDNCGKYFVYIGLSGNYHYNDTGLYIGNGERLPESFVYYDKETVRYNETTGWDQGSEGMGFIFEGMGYAGHREVKETVEYLEETYGENYKYHYATFRLSHLLTNCANSTPEDEELSESVVTEIETQPSEEVTENGTT